MVCCAASIIKILLGIFNFIFLVLGGGIAYIGYKLKSWNQDYTQALKLADIDFKSLPIIILAIGVVLVLIAFFGFFGACCENSFMLNTYGLLMVVLIAGQVYALVYSIIHKTNFEEKIENGIKKAIKEIHNNTDTEAILNKLQCSLQCCGWTGPSDFNSTKLPDSCCGKCSKSNDGFCEISKVEYKDGCDKKIPTSELSTLFGSSIGVSIVIILIQFIIVFAACCLAREYQ